MPRLVDEPLAGDGWIHEIKHDGYRTLRAMDGPGAAMPSSRSAAMGQRLPGTAGTEA